MTSPVLTLTAIESGFGFLLASTVLYLVLSRGRKGYHYIFAAFLLICAIWDLGIFLTMVRNEHVEELDTIGRIAVYPCLFIPALIFHFSTLYTGRPARWEVALIWASTAVSGLLVLAGVAFQIEGVHTYGWGSIFRTVPNPLNLAMIPSWFGVNLWACWLLYTSAQKADSLLQRRHYLYVLSAFLVVTVAIVKTLVTMGVDISFVLPLGMFLNDVFVAIIGLAIIKDRLFDITVIVQAGTLYSILAGLLLFVYSLAEHVFVTYVGEAVAEHASSMRFISIAIGIAVLIPVKSRLEKTIERYFAHRSLEF